MQMNQDAIAQILMDLRAKSQQTQPLTIEEIIRTSLEQERAGLFPSLNNYLDKFNQIPVRTREQMIEDQRDADANESILPDPDLKPYWKRP